MIPSIRCAIAVFCFFCGISINAQTIVTPLTEGQESITGTAMAAGATVQLCVSADKPASRAPVTCPGGAYEGLVPVAPAGVTAIAAGNFTAVLATPLAPAKWVYAVQTVAGVATAGNASQVAGMKAPAISSPLTPPISVISGTAQPPSAVYTAVNVFVCFSATTTDSGGDCSTTPAERAQIDPGGGAVAVNSAQVSASGNFAVTLQTPIPAGDAVWLWQVVTTAGAKTRTAASTGKTTAASPTRPTIVKPLSDGQSPITGTATKPAIGDPVFVQLWAKKAANDSGAIEDSTVMASSVGSKVTVDQDGHYAIQHAVAEGQTVFVRQSSTNPLTPIALGYQDSDDVTVGAPENERVYIDFIGGILLSQQQTSFSQANLFLALNIDEAFHLPGAYRKILNSCDADGKPIRNGTSACRASHHMGLNGFFQARLTAIPVTSVDSTTTTATTATPGTTTDSVETFLASRKTAHFEMGLYSPMYFGQTHLPGSRMKQAFFVAPIARFGFNTLISDATTSTAAAASGSTGTTTVTSTPVGVANPSTSVYNFGVMGARIGASELKAGSPHIVHYVDIGVGRFSNLRNLYCSTSRTDLCLTGASAGPPVVVGTLDPTKENHYTPFRLLVEGYMDIDGFILGFSVNSGVNLHGFRPKDLAQGGSITAAQDDVRFLLGYKLDINKLLTAVKKSSTF